MVPDDTIINIWVSAKEKFHNAQKDGAYYWEEHFRGIAAALKKLEELSDERFQFKFKDYIIVTNLPIKSGEPLLTVPSSENGVTLAIKSDAIQVMREGTNSYTIKGQDPDVVIMKLLLDFSNKNP